MVRRVGVGIPLLLVGTILAVALIDLGGEPARNRPCVGPAVGHGGPPAQHRDDAIRLPVDLSISLAEPAVTGAPVTLVVSVSTRVPVGAGTLTLRVPPIDAEPGRTQVLWAGEPANFVMETRECAVGILPLGQYHFAAIFEFGPDAEHVEEAGLSASLYLDVRTTGILSSNVSFDQIKRLELRSELERRIALSLRPELSIASEEAVTHELARLEAADPGFLDRQIEELKATDPSVAYRIMELNAHLSESADAVNGLDGATAGEETRDGSPQLERPEEGTSKKATLGGL